MKIGIGCDHSACDLRNAIKEHLTQKGYEVVDFGTPDGVRADYPVIGKAVAEKVADKTLDFGIVICGTGIGISLAANKVKGIRCALLSDTYSARMTRDHNDSNMMALGARVIGVELAKDIVDTFLTTECPRVERHMARVQMIADIENER
ncbi:MAG: ribose 5-phosphate isomerase B [Christensenellaceae bacterium]|nr:ribose 5-phosphate isomerase B [Christensenellaceae bacterium]